MIQYHRGNVIFAYSLNLRHGTNNQAEAKAFLYGVEWCVMNKYEYNFADIDSKNFVNFVNYINSITWIIYDEERNLKPHRDY